jgi:hypothetical protein
MLPDGRPVLVCPLCVGGSRLQGDGCPRCGDRNARWFSWSKTMPDLKHDIFRLAPRELSHSAFWGWVIQSADGPESVISLEGPRTIARSLLEALKIRWPRSVWVRTEAPLGKDVGRVDILVSASEGRDPILAIEHKVTAIPDAGQARRYKEGLVQKSNSRSYPPRLTTMCAGTYRVRIWARRTCSSDSRGCLPHIGWTPTIGPGWTPLLHVDLNWPSTPIRTTQMSSPPPCRPPRGSGLSWPP